MWEHTFSKPNTITFQIQITHNQIDTHESFFSIESNGENFIHLISVHFVIRKKKSYNV